MPGKSKQARAREFSPEARAEIIQRDHGECIFCSMRYRMEGSSWYSRELKSIMHYIPRAHNGLGIPQNGALGCQWHHDMMDHGTNHGNRAEMLSKFKEYLRSKYPDWDESKLIYSKWNF